MEELNNLLKEVQLVRTKRIPIVEVSIVAQQVKNLTKPRGRKQVGSLASPQG